MTMRPLTPTTTFTFPPAAASAGMDARIIQARAGMPLLITTDPSVKVPRPWCKRSSWFTTGVYLIQIEKDCKPRPAEPSPCELLAHRRLHRGERLGELFRVLAAGLGEVGTTAAAAPHDRRQ